MKKILAILLAGMMTATALAGCGGSSSSGSSKDDSKNAAGNAKNGKVYYLNFKPEQDKDWQALAKKYTDETGVEVTVKTAAEGTFESTLTAEMDKDNAPTLFQVNGPVGLANWKDYCYDLKDSAIYGELTSEDFALKDGDAVAGIAYVIESYGLITNKTLLEKAGYTIDDIAEKLEENNICNSKEFIDSVKNYELPKYISNNPNKRYNLEGFLFPDTYSFNKNEKKTKSC